MKAMDAIAVLKKDHSEVERLFVRFERTRSAPERRRLAERIVRELSIHAAVEEQLVYPRLRGRLDGAEGEVLLALEEHHFTKVALSEIEALPAESERLAPKVRVLAENVRRHVQEEERQLLPALKRLVTAEELLELGDALLAAKRLAPTRPHPTAPDEPPGNVLTTPAAAVYDRGRDALSRGLELVVERGRGVVDRALRRGEQAARSARQRIGRGLEQAGREVRTTSH
ncbi:MAG TPA: hemerythrin domain-containing protein [Anaeromyxobacter sp.]|nr:hemerythrin domain-containing protein [Anaeromyxobacter sp.]